MKSLDASIAPWLKGKSAYLSPHIDRAWENPELARMMSNEYPLPPTKSVKEAIDKYATIGNRYPDAGAVVRSCIAEINRLDGRENVLLGNGSNEVLDMSIRTFVTPGDEVILQSPCYFLYGLRCEAAGGKIVSVPIALRDGDFAYDYDGVLKAITPRTKVIIFGNPNNPTGHYADETRFLEVVETGIPVIVDEAYVEFAGLEKSKVGHAKKHPNVIVSRTLSKAYGLAGLRFGYALGHPDTIRQISVLLMPWNVGTIAMWAGLAALQDRESLHERVDFIRRERENFVKSLSDVPGLKIYPCQSNFMLFDAGGTGRTGKEIVAEADKNGLMIRAQKEMYGNNGWFRVTIGAADENRHLIKVLKDYLVR
ncbi:MAG: histidinol-phosphate transaminase [Anaerolineales bacterium]|jgi:histidinol-phosphate aminotransferase